MLHNLKSIATIAGNEPGKPDRANTKNNPTPNSTANTNGPAQLWTDKAGIN